MYGWDRWRTWRGKEEMKKEVTKYAEKWSEVGSRKTKRNNGERRDKQIDNQKMELEMMHKSGGRELQKWRENKTAKGKKKYKEERKRIIVSKFVAFWDLWEGQIVLWSNMGERWNGKKEHHKRRESLGRNCKTVPFVEQNYQGRQIIISFSTFSHTIKTTSFFF